MEATENGVLADFPECRGSLSRDGEPGRLERNRAKVLVMDDEEMIRECLGLFLGELGFSVEMASDGDEAVESCRKAAERGEPHDVVIMDLNVAEGVGGGEALKRVLRIEPRIKAIVSSGNPRDARVVNFKEYGFSAVILKPMRLEKIEQALAEALRGPRALAS